MQKYKKMLEKMFKQLVTIDQHLKNCLLNLNMKSLYKKIIKI